ncbi:hypothetical protein Ato02nite_006670 [Paractinoplanes toevensis]|uniref:Uncharacterized protein n=1 Tax=Paractinoplanes toevensis TaxID=571911 RepID=A0A919T6Y3_9ACTN|nr:hypothetical protein Ato02nite_006670 [Actinoplanes toevensis]
MRVRLGRTRQVASRPPGRQLTRAGFLVVAELPRQCTEETRSWDHFTSEQADSYWIRCTLSGPHDEHEDEHTGLTWRTDASRRGLRG